ncbi:MAG TPA: ATP-binding protein [Enhygromyxa sp.]|nr:ATP-binding protein [Enhygromyxa sp.]
MSVTSASTRYHRAFDISRRDCAWRSSEQRRDPSAANDGEHDYRGAFEAIDQGFCIIEVLFDDQVAVDYRFVAVNPAFERQTGIQHAVGRRMRDIAPNHESHWFDIYGRVALTGEPVRFERPAAALGRHYDVNAVRLGPPEQRRVAVLFRDVTEHKRLADRAQRLVDELSLINRRKDEFLASLAHELRNPLAAIKGASLLLHQLRQPDDRVAVEQLHSTIERQVNHMARLIDDLVDLSSVNRGVVELRRQSVDLEEVVGRAIETSRPLLEVGHRQLIVDVCAEPLLVDGDPVRLNQVVTNLLDNAAKYTDERGRIWVTLDRDGDRARLSVRDDGVGVPQSMLEQIFDMFTQVDRKAEGLGIGLSLVRSLVARHGGAVEVHSDGIGRGCEFIVRLPLLR